MPAEQLTVLFMRSTTCQRIFALFFFLASQHFQVAAQTSVADGNWDTGAIWSGGSVPNPGTWPTINANHAIVRTANYTVSGTLNINAGANVTFSNNLTVSAGSVINVYGNLNVTGNVLLNSNLRIFPGGKLIVDGTLRVSTSYYLTVGTSPEPPPYADLVVKGNLTSVNGGKITVNNNGRMAIYGDFNNEPATGDSQLILNDGAQVFIYGDINLTGNGGDDIVNNNTGDYNGLYIGGTVTIPTGAGSTITGGPGPEGPYLPINQMPSDNNDFFQWLLLQPDIPIDSTLPVQLVSFRVSRRGDVLEAVWTTASETNNDYFTIGLSTDGRYFEPIGTVQGRGNANELFTYTWPFHYRAAGTAYLRLTQTDFDGAFEHLGTVVISAPSGDGRLEIYPNPASAGAEVYVVVDLGEQADWRLLGADGHIVESGVATALTTISTTRLMPGVYTLMIDNGKGRKVAKLVVK